MDDDLNGMSREQLVAECKKLRAGIREHRDAKGHNLCWWTPELWGLLPERELPDPQPPPMEEFIAACRLYRSSLGGAK